jgi:hypothetical protein
MGVDGSMSWRSRRSVGLVLTFLVAVTLVASKRAKLVIIFSSSFTLHIIMLSVLIVQAGLEVSVFVYVSS